MKRTKTTTVISLIIAISLGMAGCAKKLASSSSDAGNLEYGFTGNEAYSYLQSSRTIQTIVFGGQEVNTTINTDLGFTAKGKGIVNGDLILEIMVDTMGVSINAMGTNMNEEISSVKGKSFMMNMSTKGADKDLDEAEKISYSIAGLQTSNMGANFLMIFPELPEANISVGYTWVDNDTITVNTETENAELILVSNNKVEGREEVAGYDCYKISYQATGTRDGSSQTPQGMVVTNTDVKASGYYYFAIKEGIVVSDNSEMKAEGDVIIPTGESIPLYMTSTSDLKLL